MAREFKVDKCPHEALTFTNRVFFNKDDLDTEKIRIVEVTNGAVSMLFSTASEKTKFPNSETDQLAKKNVVALGKIGLNAAQRKFLNVGIGSALRVAPFEFKASQAFYAASVVLELDFVNRKSLGASEQFNTEKLASDFTGSTSGMVICVGQQLLLNFTVVTGSEKDKKEKVYTAVIMVKEIEAVSQAAMASITDGKVHNQQQQHVRAAVVIANTSVIFDKPADLNILLTGRNKGKGAFQPIINPDWDFTKMGIGGLDNEFSAIFRRAFASRVFPPELIMQLGLKHVRGILLYGPPGTGKTLMARQIGKMLNAREPKIVSGPQILDKYVGESEANVRKLFADAEEEEKRSGPNSGLHIVIFDEIDAICKQRGSVAGATQVHDTVVNQLLAKMDGVEQLNNILVIGMTNRLDMIDDALLRPGRFEVKMEISLPDEQGRLQILNIHTERLRENRKLASDVNLAELASSTKNFSGAEIEGLCRAAVSTSMNRLVKAKVKVEVDPDAIERLVVTRDDFLNALQNDVKPAFGSSSEDLSVYVANGIIPFGDPVTRVLSDSQLLINQVKNVDTRTPLVTVLLAGPAGAGKTALAAHIAQRSGFPFVKICSPETMIGYSESAKCATIKRFFDDAYKSPLSCVILDDIERLLDYSPLGQRYSNLVLQALLVLLKKLPVKERRLLVIGTTSNRDVLANLELLNVFSATVHVSNLTKAEHVVNALQELADFNEKETSYVVSQITGKHLSVGIKKFLVFLEMARQSAVGQRAEKLIMILEDEGFLYSDDAGPYNRT